MTGVPQPPLPRERPHGPGPLNHAVALDPVMLLIHEQMRQQRMAWKWTELDSGLGADTLRFAFRHGRDLRLRHARAVLQTLGYHLTVVPLGEQVDS